MVHNILFDEENVTTKNWTLYPMLVINDGRTKKTYQKRKYVRMIRHA